MQHGAAALIVVGLAAACAGRAIEAERSAEPVVVAAEGKVERFSLRAGETHPFGLLELLARDVDAAGASATLVSNDGGDALSLGAGRCPRGRGFVYSLERVDEAESSRAIGRFARIATTEPRDVSMGGSLLMSSRDTMRAPDGSLIWVAWPWVTVERGGAQRRFASDVRSDVGYSVAIDGTMRLFVLPTGDVDAIGCAIMSLTLKRNEVVVPVVDEGTVVALADDEKFRVQGLVVEFVGWGERLGSDGPASVWASLELEVAGVRASRDCMLGAECVFEGYVIEVVDVVPGEARVRVRHRAGR